MRRRLLAMGVDLRLMEGEDFRHTELIKQPERVEARASQWKSALLDRAWSEDVEGPSRMRSLQEAGDRHSRRLSVHASAHLERVGVDRRSGSLAGTIPDPKHIVPVDAAAYRGPSRADTLIGKSPRF